jgi:hypothetical protein
MHRPLAHRPRAGLGLTPYGRGLIEALGAGHGHVSKGRRARHQTPAAEKGAQAKGENCVGFRGNPAAEWVFGPEVRG